ncbi:hypothetical protein [Nonomuraea sp. SYSU D8015]|uniref:hypothetical protein n=1 Tax=Nonomuraea sp. SYSU D8015 TaxID=2593644 RepID=UPI00166183FE|nr:hypothetical protein [Nonomuraea sp. SYSU D8015]
MSSRFDGEMELHAGSLQFSGSGLHTAMKELTDHWVTLGNALDALEPMVGEDLISQLIGASYKGIREAADETLGSVMSGLQSYGTGVLQMDVNRSSAEQRSIFDLGRETSA